MRDAYASTDPALALRQLERLANSVERNHPGAAASLREGLAETLTLTNLGVTGWLYRCLRSTNLIESLNGQVAHFTHNVRRWRDGEMIVRWVATAVREALSALLSWGMLLKLRGPMVLKIDISAPDFQVVPPLSAFPYASVVVPRRLSLTAP